MIDKIKEYIVEVEVFIVKIKEEVEIFWIKYFGSKGFLKDFFVEFKNVVND